jgi:hypothetical protein
MPARASAKPVKSHDKSRIKLCGRAKLSSEMTPLEQLYRARFVGFRKALAPICGSDDAARDVVQKVFAIGLCEQRKLLCGYTLHPRLVRRSRGPVKRVANACTGGRSPA